MVNMQRFEQLSQRVKELYKAKDPNRDPWCDWLYDDHVLVVAEKARHLAEAKHANVELAEAAALLHDIADVKMPRTNENHEAESLAIGRQIMHDCNYTDEEIALVVDDAVRLHSCYDDKRPSSREGQVLATADSLAHLETDFYVRTTWLMGNDNRPLEGVKSWVLKKIERDLNSKISFDDVREQVRPSYEAVKLLFSR
jgi:putative nucleotidyltransferase with HDIG domain